MKKIESIRGMNDLLPSDSPTWQYLESQVADLLRSYGYREIRFPILEKTELFKRGIGEVTDIVEKEMYTFNDRNDESLTLRPEGTASCVRACEQNKLLFDRGNLVQKLWYTGPMFRYEKPQKGRLRQFHQIGVETYGLPGPDIDAELLIMTARLWRQLGIDGALELQINSLGSSESRNTYRAALVSYLESNHSQLDEDSQRRLKTNPLRVLDSKNADTQVVLKDAPQLLDFLDDDSRAHFEGLQKTLKALGIGYRINPRLVRGLDYYCDTVFEWVTDKLGSQGTVCAGGRYDGLIAQLGGKPTSAIGFAMGIERLVLLLDTLNVVPVKVAQVVDVYLLVGAGLESEAFVLAEDLRSKLPTLRLQMHCGGGSFKSQMKKADKSGAELALILGEDEARDGMLTVKYLRTEQAQQTINQNEITQILV